MSTVNFQIGDDVRWIDNPFTIVEIKNDKALLKQRFSIGIELRDLVPIGELTLEASYIAKERESRLDEFLNMKRC
ncbi:MAG: hypothetical protein SLAVMIC_00343 [uncultured marine phage]|uniref:Uncharacterized protein n=1 Tax=uncultured marine phage TaxID=707152 RepID=A0A8D9FQ55_9VIRU|nr:MAG: hypothetical protein SLAVMIC_00343 [uncultured marine phage]